MHVTTSPRREFNQDTSGAKRAASNGPVFITDRGKPSPVLLAIVEYRRLTGTPEKISRALSMPADDMIDFEPPRLGDFIRPSDLS